MEYECLICNSKNNPCPVNTSGYGICSNCVPSFQKVYGKGDHKFFIKRKLDHDVIVNIEANFKEIDNA